ncbi:MAG: bactofilin family protein [Myxococcota bacterium]
MSTNAKQTIVEEGTEFRGTLLSTCPIVVRGRIEGEIDTPALSVSEKGSVHGRAKVGTIKSLGELSGEFDADTVELAGRVKDNTIIRAKSLEVKLASDDNKMQVMFGDTELAVGDAPEDETNVTRKGRSQRPPKPSSSEPTPSAV